MNYNGLLPSYSISINIGGPRGENTSCSAGPWVLTTALFWVIVNVLSKAKKSSKEALKLPAEMLPLSFITLYHMAHLEIALKY